MSDLSNIIVSELVKHGIKVVPNDNSANIKAYCFNGHDKETPSLAIRKRDGAFYCFGCGVKGPNWNVLAKKIGAKELEEDDLPDPFVGLYEHLNNFMSQNDITVDLPFGVVPWSFGDWRNLPEKFIKMFNAYKWHDTTIKADRILFPIIQEDAFMGWVARRLDNNNEMKYRNSPNLPSKQILFPFDFVVDRSPKTVVLVEGPFDALRLIRYRIPALAIMGTNNFSELNTSMLSAFVDNVIICTDNDEAGKKCRFKLVEPLCKSYGISVTHFFPPVNSDPGAMPISYIKRLKALIKHIT